MSSHKFETSSDTLIWIDHCSFLFFFLIKSRNLPVKTSTSLFWWFCTHSACVGRQVSFPALHMQPSPLALAQTSQLGYRPQPWVWTRATDRGLLTRAPPWKHKRTFTEPLNNKIHNFIQSWLLCVGGRALPGAGLYN